MAARTLSEELDSLLRLFYYNAKHLSSFVQEPLRLADLSANEEVGNESFPSCLEGVASALGDLRARLNDFREYTVGFVSPPLLLRV